MYMNFTDNKQTIVLCNAPLSFFSICKHRTINH